MVTREDVAKRAGVSPAVVSYVLNHSNYVSQQKREAVLKAVQELHYTPNYVARGLKTNCTFHFVLVGDDVRNEFYSEIVYYMEEYLYRKGFSISLCSSRIEDAFFESLIGRQYDGVFLASNKYSVEQINLLASKIGSLVFYQTREYIGLDSRVAIVAADYYQGTKQAMQYLIGQGHRRIAFVPPHRFRLQGIGDRDFRLMGYVDTLRENGLPIEKELICQDTREQERTIQFVRDRLSFEADRRPTAILIGNDYLAARIVQSLKRMGFLIPEDVAIVGMDNTNSSEICTPTLTTIEVSGQTVACKASKALTDILDGNRPENISIPTKLIVRQST